MRHENLENPCCPHCLRTMKCNGYINGRNPKLGISHKLRYRCSHCGYSETRDSTAHNSNKRTWFGHCRIHDQERTTYRNSVRQYTNTHVPLKPNCEICGSTEKLEHHHWNYDKPLDVTTMCKNCHVLTERILRKFQQNPLDPQLINLLFSRNFPNSNIQSVNQDKRLEPNLCYPLAKCEGVSYP